MQQLSGAGREAARGARDVGEAEQAQQPDREVAQRRHPVGVVVGAGLREIFPEGYIAHPMRAVLDAPVFTVELEQLLGAGLLRGEAGQPVYEVLARFAASELGDLPLQADLSPQAAAQYSSWRAALTRRRGQEIRGHRVNNSPEHTTRPTQPHQAG